jgi:hypothetical protein
MRRHGLLIIGLASVLSGMGAGWRCHTTRSGCVAGLPEYDYVWGNISQAKSVFSLDPIDLGPRQAYGPGVPAGLPPRERVKVYQLLRPTVTLDHCSLSRVALTLNESGEATLSLRADQNPWMTGPLREVSNPLQVHGPVSAVKSTAPNLGKETDSLKRNQFFVKVRCYGAFKLKEELTAMSPGKPVLVELPTAMFWVQRGYPYDFMQKLPMRDVARYFDLIDRVEVEFSYR